MNINVDISKVVLKTKRLILRPWKLTDLEDFYEYAKVDGVGEMAGWQHHQSKDESLKILHRFIENKKTFALEYEGKVIGSLGLEMYPESELPEYNKLKGREIGYVLSKDYWGQGLMPEAVKRVIEYLFDDLLVDFIVCGHFVTNNQSKRVQEKCGFKHYKMVKHRGKNGETIDCWLSVLEREAYERSN